MANHNRTKSTERNAFVSTKLNFISQEDTQSITEDGIPPYNHQVMRSARQSPSRAFLDPVRCQLRDMNLALNK